MSNALLLLAAGTLASLAPATAQDVQNARSYRIRPYDQLQIRVEEEENLNQELEVAGDGTVNLPLVGAVRVEGLTETELAGRLQILFEAKGLRQATVTTSVINVRSRPVSILGAVAQPGNHLVTGRATLVEVLMDAGGVTTAHGGEIIVRRRADNGLSDELRVPIADLFEAGAPELNIPIFAGDLINVPVARGVTVHLIGQVATPGSLDFKPGQEVTLLTAIARAGGISETASRKIRILRNSPSGEREEIVVDFKRLLNNRDPDVVLADGDLVVVKESFF